MAVSLGLAYALARAAAIVTDLGEWLATCAAKAQDGLMLRPGIAILSLSLLSWCAVWGLWRLLSTVFAAL